MLSHLTVGELKVCNAKNALIELPEREVPVPFLPSENKISRKILKANPQPC